MSLSGGKQKQAHFKRIKERETDIVLFFAGKLTPSHVTNAPGAQSLAMKINIVVRFVLRSGGRQNTAKS